MNKWPETRLRYVAELNPRVRVDLLADPTAEVSFLPMEAIGEDGSLDLKCSRRVEEVRNGYSYFEDGDVAFAKVTPCFENGKGALMAGLELGAGFGTSELTVLRAHDGVGARFLNYVVRSEHFRQNGAGAMTGAGGLKRVPDEFTRDFKTPWPAPSEQERIANFLDEQTTRIDALIAAKESLAATVDEQTDSVVSSLVCGGKALDAGRRETGWRFLPQLPSHWGLCHLRWIAKRVDVGIAEAATHAYADEGVPILRSTNIRPNSIEGKLLRVQPWFAERNASKTLFRNDLVTIRTGYPGVTAVVPAELDGCQCFTLLITTLSEGYIPAFYARYLNAAPARGYFAVESWGSAQQNISVPILKELYVPRLPLNEQIAIVDACERAEVAGRNLSTHVAQHIAHLREYRSSLISAAVTGQLDLGAYDERKAA